MPAPIKVHFAIAGSKELDAAFKAIMDRVRQLNQVEQQVGLARERAASKSARAVVASNDNASKAVAAAKDREAKAAEKAAERQKKAAERAAEATEKAAKRAADKTEKESKRAADHAAREAKRGADAQIREMNRAAAKANELAKQRASAVTGIAGRAAGGTLRTVGGIAAGLGATIGTYAIGQSLFSNLALNERAALLVNATADKQGRPTQTVAGLTSEAQNIAKRYGMESGDVMSAMETVAARAGGAEGLNNLRKDLDDLAKTAKAFGVNMGDMGAVAAAAFGAGVDPGEELRTLMQDLVAMGKDGSVEFKDLASELARLAGAGLAFGSGADMIRRSVGLAQIAVRQKVSPEEARTSVIDLFRDLNTKAQDLKHSGVKVFTPTGKQRDPADILAETVHAAFGGKGIWGGKGKGFLKGTEGLAHVYTGTSLAIASAMGEEYMKAGKGTGGMQAIKDAVDKASSSKLAPGERDKALANVMATPNAAMAQMKANFEEEIGKLVPEFQKLLPQLADLTLKFAKLAVWVGQNPFRSLGILFAGMLTKEIAAAGIGMVLKNAVTAALGGQAAAAGGLGSGIGGIVGPGSAIRGAMTAPVGALAARGALGAATLASGVAAAGTAGLAAGWWLGGETFDPLAKKAGEEGGATRAALINHEVELARLRKEASRGSLSADSQARLKGLISTSGAWGDATRKSSTVEGINNLNPWAHFEAGLFKTQAGEGAAEGFDKVKAGAEALAKSMETLQGAIAAIKPPDKSDPNDPSRSGKPGL